MQLSARMLELLNTQLTNELYSAHLYLSVAAYFEAVNLKGFAKYYQEKSREEHKHALLFFDYIADRLGRIQISTLTEPPTFQMYAVLDVVTMVYDHEQKISAAIQEIIPVAINTEDTATRVFAEKMIMEQVEEEATANILLEKIRFIGDDKGALLDIDEDLAEKD